MIEALEPAGVFLSNGPGDPAATGEYAVTAIQGVLAKGIPVFGICLGHQLLALALGAKTYKLERGHRGANQPVKDLMTGKVEITAQNGRYGPYLKKGSDSRSLESEQQLFDYGINFIRADLSTIRGAQLPYPYGGRQRQRRRQSRQGRPQRHRRRPAGRIGC